MIWIVIPINNLSDAKSSLSETLKNENREKLVLCMLDDVLSAVKRVDNVSIVVVSPDRKVLEFARSRFAKPVLDRDIGLNSAIKLVIDKAKNLDVESIIIIPGDVPMLKSSDIINILNMKTGVRDVVITPSNENGTNALLLHPPDVMETHFGGESFPKHINEARSNGINPKIYNSERLERDIDNPADLLKIESLGIGTKTHDFLRKIIN